MKHYIIGEILEDGTRVKGWGNGGYEYFQDSKAFYEKSGICYIDEDDFEYTYKDFIELTKGHEDLAESYFDIVSGTSPEFLLDEDLNSGAVCYCKECDTYHHRSELDDCPHYQVNNSDI